MSYFAYVHQEGGCDYTIGCGNLLLGLGAKTEEEAKEELKEVIKERFQGDYRIEEAMLFSGETIDFDLESVYNEIDEEKKAAKKQKEEQEEKAQYEALKKKFG